MTTYGYDAVGRVTSVTDPLGRVTATAYDALGRVVTVTRPDPDGGGSLAAPVMAYAYDAASRLTTVTDPLGKITAYGYDNLDRLTTLTAPDPDGAGAQTAPVTAFTYDTVGNRTGITDPVGNTTAYAYDALDRITTITDPLSKTTTLAYDAADQLTVRTDRIGRVTTYAHDNLGRRTHERWLDAVGGTVRTVTSAYDAASQLVGVADPDATLSFTYDGLGRPTSEATSGSGTGQPSLTLTSAYDAVGNRTRLADSLSGGGGAGAGITTYAYDALDRLTTIARSLGSQAGPQVAFAYDAAGRRTAQSRTLGGTGTAVDTTFSYDALDRVTTLTHQVGGGSSLAGYAYGYDVGSRLTSETNAEGPATYSYDDLGQLTGADRTANDEAYTYDANGNRTLAGYTTGANNRILASPGATYTYDALGRRIGTDVDADGAGSGVAVREWTAYDGDEAYADFDGAGALKVRYLHGPAVDELLARTGASGTTAWYLTDRLGSVRDVASTAGAVIYHSGYDAFGQRTDESGTGGDEWGFTGREHVTGTGLSDHRTRFVDVALGVWTQEDPIGFDGGDPNLRRYVGNGPTNATDPSGLAETRSYVTTLGEYGYGFYEGIRRRLVGAARGARNVGAGVIDSVNPLTLRLPRCDFRQDAERIVEMMENPKVYLRGRINAIADPIEEMLSNPEGQGELFTYAAALLTARYAPPVITSRLSSRVPETVARASNAARFANRPWGRRVATSAPIAGAAYDPNRVPGPNPNSLRQRAVTSPTPGEGGVYLKPEEGRTKIGSTGDFRTRYGANPTNGIEVEIPQTRTCPPAGVDDSAYPWNPRAQRRFDEEYIDRLIPQNVRYRAPNARSPVDPAKWENYRHIYGYGDLPSNFGR